MLENNNEHMFPFKTLANGSEIDPLPSLMVEVCLVLAPDVNLILNSHKRGFPLKGQQIGHSLLFLFLPGLANQ